jgi:hypothetical protein
MASLKSVPAAPTEGRHEGARPAGVLPRGSIESVTNVHIQHTSNLEPWVWALETREPNAKDSHGHGDRRRGRRRRREIGMGIGDEGADAIER